MRASFFLVKGAKFNLQVLPTIDIAYASLLKSGPEHGTVVLVYSVVILH